MKNSYFTLFVFLISAQILSAQSVPRLEWVSQMGGTGYNSGEDIYVDAVGNIYTTGLFWGTVDFDPGPGTFNLTSAGTSDIFITKQDPSGLLIWAVRMGGTGNDEGFSITVDLAGNVLTTGHFRNTVDFDPGPGVFNLSAGFYDSFISKLDAFGNFVWAIKFGEATNDENGYSIAVDAAGNVYSTGSYSNTVDFDPGVGVFNLTSACNGIYVSKLSPTGDFVWAKSLGRPGCGEAGNSILVDASGEVYITGLFQGTADFDPDAGTFNLTSAGGFDIYICKLDINGSFVWAKQLGGASSSDEGKAMVMDGLGNLLITGNFAGTADFDPDAGVFSLSSVGGLDVFVCKLNNLGDFVWAKSFGGSSNDYGHDITIDPSGNVYTIGEFRGVTDFDPGPSVFNLDGGSVDGFVSKLDASGNMSWAIEIGGSGFDYGYGIAVDPLENVYTTGSFYSSNTDFDPTPCPFLVATLGSGDIFIQKLNKATPLPPQHTITTYSPAIGPIGSTVIITGTNFSTTLSNNTVLFNTSAAVVNASTTTSITTTVPAGATTGKISVTINCITVQSATNFTVGASPLPTISSFTPSSGFIGTTVTITGTNFSTTPANNTVQFNGTTAVVSASSPTSITTTVPIGATTGTISVTVGGNTATSATDFTILPAALPTITSFTPATGSIGTTVVITGTNFSATPSNNLVMFNGTTAIVTASTTTTITTTVPSGTTTGKISVTVAGNTATSANDFAIQTTVLPTITSFSPSGGPIGTAVTITGTNFSTIPSENTVMFNGTNAAVSASTASSITTTVPSGATSGKITVTLAGNTATSATDFTITTISNQPPVINSTGATVPIAGSTSIDLTLLISDIDNNLDLTTLKIVSQPSSEAFAQITNNVLIIDYTGLNFSGQDRITIEVCDLLGSCTQQEIIIDVVGDLIIHTGISPNGDPFNQKWIIQNIESMPDTRENKVSIYSRWGDLVFETENYDNKDRVFKGINKSGNEVGSGIYFYKIEFTSGRKSLSGYLHIKT